MPWKQFALCILVMACVTSEIAAQDPTGAPLFQQWIVGRTKFTFVGGRVVGNNGAWLFGTGQSSVDGPVREQVNFNGGGVAGSLVYSYVRKSAKPDPQNDPKVEFGVEISSDGRFVLRYSCIDHPEQYFHLTQIPGQPVSLSLPPSDKPHVLRAPTLWHLLVIHREECGKQFLPMLEAIRADWHVGLAAQTIEDELVKMAAVSQKSDRKQWGLWVSQLGDPDHWAVRDRADQHLRDAGPAVLGYLNRLDASQLDAEQKSRLRRIIRDLSVQAGEDTPEHVASMLVEDPLVWLALLSRPDESTRQAAFQQLTVLLNVPIAFDPKAEPDTQAKAREKLRAQIEKLTRGGLQGGG